MRVAMLTCAFTLLFGLIHHEKHERGNATPGYFNGCAGQASGCSDDSSGNDDAIRQFNEAEGDKGFCETMPSTEAPLHEGDNVLWFLFQGKDDATGAILAENVTTPLDYAAGCSRAMEDWKNVDPPKKAYTL